MKIKFLLLTLIIVKIGSSQCSVMVMDNSTCTDSCQGEAIAIGQVGTQPFSYLWSNDQTTETATGLCADSTYWVILTDAEDCQYTAYVTIQSALTIEIGNVTDASCPDCCDGSIEFTTVGGFIPYYFETINTNNLCEPYYSNNNFCVGTNQICVTDSHTCRRCNPFTIGATTSANPISKKNNLKLYPNPTNKLLKIEIFETDFEVMLLNQSGKLLQQFTNKKEINIENYSAGQYFVKIIGQNKTETQTIIIY